MLLFCCRAIMTPATERSLAWDLALLLAVGHHWCNFQLNTFHTPGAHFRKEVK